MRSVARRFVSRSPIGRQCSGCPNSHAAAGPYFTDVSTPHQEVTSPHSPRQQVNAQIRAIGMPVVPSPTLTFVLPTLLSDDSPGGIAVEEEAVPTPVDRRVIENVKSDITAPRHPRANGPRSGPEVEAEISS